MKRRLLALYLMTPLLLAACSEDATIWSADSQSPDGRWIAHARTVRHGGFGTAGVETVVELKLQSGLRDTVRVLAFADGGAAMHLRMGWPSASHFQVTYEDDPSMLYYQVVKTSGIEITVQDLASEAAPKATRGS